MDDECACACVCVCVRERERERESCSDAMSECEMMGIDAVLFCFVLSDGRPMLPLPRSGSEIKDSYSDCPWRREKMSKAKIPTLTQNG